MPEYATAAIIIDTAEDHGAAADVIDGGCVVSGEDLIDKLVFSSLSLISRIVECNLKMVERTYLETCKQNTTYQAYIHSDISNPSGRDFSRLVKRV